MTTTYSKTTENVASRSQGVHGSGARTYRPDQAARVLLILRNECVGAEHTMTVDTLAARVGLNGRAVRDIVRDLEIARQVLTDFSHGYFVCRTADEAERSTRRLESQVTNMTQRIVARRAMTAELVNELAPEPSRD